MKRIYKYKIKEFGDTHLTMPAKAKFLSVGVQGGYPIVYAEVDPDKFRMADTVIRVYQTGDNIPDHVSETAEFIGTFMLSDGQYVGHVYKVQKSIYE